MNTRHGSYILMLPKWYPDKLDPQFGVFIQKQALAISRKRKIIVCSFHAHTDTKKAHFLPEANKHDNLIEYRIYYKKDSSLFSPVLNAIRYYKAWSEAKKIILAEHGTPELIHAYILLRPAILAYISSKQFGVPMLVSEQWSGYTNGKFSARPALIRYLSKLVFRKAHARTAVSQFLKTNMEKLGFAKPIEVIPNVIEIQDLKIRTPSEEINILLVADLVDEIKNISGVIVSFSEALVQFPNLRLRIIGHGKDELKLKSMAAQLGLPASVVQFDGLKSNSEVYEALWNCDFLVMNSRFETFSLICAEALSCGKPVIATRCGGPEEFIDESNGILIPVDDTKALTEAILRMSKSYKAYSPKLLQERAMMRFNSESIGKRFEELYSAIV